MPGDLRLSIVFQNVRDALIPFQDTLNTADSERGKHGDEMVSLFTVLAEAEDPFFPQSQLAEVLDRAAEHAAHVPDNLSAQFYAQGLAYFAEALHDVNLTVSELPSYLQAILSDSPMPREAVKHISQGQLLKALIKGLSAWEAQSSDQAYTSNLSSMNYLFELGISYLQMRKKSPDKLDAVVDVAVHHSPLKSPPYRADSGRLVISVLLASIVRLAE